MARRGLKITGGRDNIYMRDYRMTDTEAGDIAGPAPAKPVRSETGAVEASEFGACDGPSVSLLGPQAEAIDQQTSPSAEASATKEGARTSPSIRLELRTRICASVDARVHHLAARLKLTPDILHRVMRERAYKRFRAILAADEELEHGPAPETGTTVRLLMHMSRSEMATLAERFDPLSTGKVALALKGPFSRLLTAEVDRLEAAAASAGHLTR